MAQEGVDISKIKWAHHYNKKGDIVMAYSKELLDHYENPKNVGSMDKESEQVGTGLVGAPACGDVMKLQIKVNNKEL